jgi:hypothetical protein
VAGTTVRSDHQEPRLSRTGSGGVPVPVIARAGGAARQQSHRLTVFPQPQPRPASTRRASAPRAAGSGRTTSTSSRAWIAWHPTTGTSTSPTSTPVCRSTTSATPRPAHHRVLHRRRPQGAPRPNTVQARPPGPGRPGRTARRDLHVRRQLRHLRLHPPRQPVGRRNAVCAPGRLPGRCRHGQAHPAEPAGQGRGELREQCHAWAWRPPSGGRAPICWNICMAFISSQCSANMPFWTRQMSMLRISTGLPVAGMPTRSPVWAPR